MSGNKAQTKVAIMAASDQDHNHLSSLLNAAGLNVVMHEVAGENFIHQLEKTPADVLLVDLCEETESEVDVIDTLLEYDSLPVLFNDSSKAGGGTNSLWAKKLARKLEAMARDHEPVLEPVLTVVDEMVHGEVSDSVDEMNFESEMSLELESDIEDETAANANDEMPLELLTEVEDKTTDDELNDFEFELEPESGYELEVASETELELAPEENGQSGQNQDTGYNLNTETIISIEDEISEEIESLPQDNDTDIVEAKVHSIADELPDGAGKNIWVLGASLGGPQAVRQFLMAIKEDLPVAFILAQHIGENHISLLAEQLNRVCVFKVFPAYAGHMIRHREVILAPAGKNIHITEDGYISLSDQASNAIYSPCINDVMTVVAERYGNMAGTIVFSGMGDDGSIGCQSVADNGGVVWAQDVDSCVISSMPDQARKTNNVTFSANPRRLADELYDYYMK